jgi:hypothetical protein
MADNHAFISKVKEWTSLYSRKEQLQAQIKELNQKIKPLREEILVDMETKKIPGVSCGGYRLVYKETQRYPPISKKKIIECGYFPNKEASEKFMSTVQKEKKTYKNLKVIKES